MTQSALESSPPTPRKKQRRRWVFRAVRVAVIAYVVLCILTYFGQNWLVFPGATYQGTAAAAIHIERGCELLHLTTANGDHVAAIFAPALHADGSPDPDAAHRPTLIYFYGNGSSIAWSMDEFDRFRRLDANVLMPDFVGYGMSSGEPSEVNLYATADAAYDYLIHRPGIDAEKIIAVGWSLGGAVAIDLASRRHVAGLATFNAFTSMPEMARLMLPWIPTTELLKYKFNNLAKMPRITCPAFICNGKLDSLVPPTMSDRLAKAAGGLVTRLAIPQATHETIFTANPHDLFGAMGKFVETISQGY